jgi:predicted glycosyltransferase
VGCDEPLAIVRLFSWGAVHDRGHSGFTGEARAALLRRLGERARVFVLSEAPLAAEFDRYRLTVGPEKIHHLLHYARLYVGEGATMATEAGLLGTPSVYLSSLVGTMGNFDELAERYGLVYATRSADEAMREAVRLLEDPQSKAAWQEKRRRLLDEKTDVTAWMIDLARHVAGGASAGELRAWAAGA